MEEAEVDDLTLSVMMCKIKHMAVLRARLSMRDDSLVDMGYVSEEEGGACIPPPRNSTDLEAAYEGELEAMGEVC